MTEGTTAFFASEANSQTHEDPSSRLVRQMNPSQTPRHPICAHRPMGLGPQGHELGALAHGPWAYGPIGPLAPWAMCQCAQLMALWPKPHAPMGPYGVAWRLRKGHISCFSHEQDQIDSSRHENTFIQHRISLRIQRDRSRNQKKRKKLKSSVISILYRSY